jgi:hypothetical protein
MTTILHNVKVTNAVHTTGSTTVPSTIGQVYNSTGTNMTWAAGTNSVNALEPVLSISPDKAALDVTGRMVINGVDLEERLITIEKVLSIPERDVKLEKKHPKLKKLYDEYINALAKYRTFEAIKGDENGTT